jgi:hypothetical protein
MKGRVGHGSVKSLVFAYLSIWYYNYIVGALVAVVTSITTTTTTEKSSGKGKAE